jgi:DNA recombination protein RmuC
MITGILLTLFILIILSIVAFFSLKKPFIKFLNELTHQATIESLNLAEQKNKESLKEERLIQDDRLESKLKLSEEFLNAKKDLILDAVKNMRQEINQSQERLIQYDKSKVTEFQKLQTAIDQHKSVTESLQVSTNDLRNMLSNNQRRGEFGQDVAENLLKIAGFVKGQDYTTQERQETTGNRPDFTVLLPDKTKINIDVKFPFQSLQKYYKTENKEEQKKYLIDFKNDIKTKIKEVSTRDYINPEEKTVDFVIMFIPNEMIFSFIHEQYPDVSQDALKNKVIMCGPFSFIAILRMVQQSYDNFKFQKDIHNIYALIKKFEIEYTEFNKALITLGDRIDSASKQYDIVSGVRDRQLTKVMEKITSKETIPKIDASIDQIEIKARLPKKPSSNKGRGE